MATVLLAIGATVAGVLSVLNLAATFRTLQKDWRQAHGRGSPHPLEAPLRDIAAAIRSRELGLADPAGLVPEE